MTEDLCPKQMVFGPCGGVSDVGGCEVDERPCPFVGRNAPRFADAVPPTAPDGEATAAMRRLLRLGRVVIADFPDTPMSRSSIAAVGAILRDRVDAVLLGDAPQRRVQFPPTYRAQLVEIAGLRPWVGLTCRDRNRVALEGELAGLADLGVAGVHCVTGDHPSLGSRPDAAAVFDLDSTRLAALARRRGLLVSVAEAPASRPVDQRPARLIEKFRAGAEVCFVNHAGGVGPVRRFVEAVRGPMPDAMFVPCVPVVIDRASAEVLASFRSMVLPDGYLDAVLTGRDAHAAGVLAAVELAERLLEIDGVVGVNLSGGSAPGAEVGFAEALAEIGSTLRPAR